MTLILVTSGRRVRAEKVGSFYIHRRVRGAGFDDTLWTITAPQPAVANEDQAGRHLSLSQIVRDRETAVNTAELLSELLVNWDLIRDSGDVKVHMTSDQCRVVRAVLAAAT